MNRRVRSVCKSSPKRDEGYYRYLKPGALAQLRNSKISANNKSQRPDLSKIQIRVESPSSPTTTGLVNSIQDQIGSIEGFPCFSGRIFSPRCPQRKKLVASRSFFFVPSSPVSDSPDSVIRDLITTDLLVSH